MAHVKDKMSDLDDHIQKRFDIQKRLGKGAYGIVWKAIDRKTREVVAVKKIYDAFRNQMDAQRTFREIMFLQAFKSHPNIIKLHSVHRAANNKDIYLGFEYMEIDLHMVIKRGNILKDIHKRYIMYQLFKALKYIHSGNVIHRDLKPSNVLLDSSCKCKIADFGLARSLTQGEDILSENQPILTDYVATRWYRAPEILIASTTYTKGIDMWSLGCILAEMYLERPIFPGSSTVNQVEKIMTTIPTPSPQDIYEISTSHVGASMIRNASLGQKTPLEKVFGPDTPADAINLVSKLLVLNPHKRLTVEGALEHEFVSQFHDPDKEPVMPSNVVIPLNDDVRLEVDDYRKKLYQLMSNHQKPTAKSTAKPKSKLLPPEVYSRIAKTTERYLRSHMEFKNKSTTYLDPKVSEAPRNRGVSTADPKVDTRVARGQACPLHGHEFAKMGALKSRTEIPKRRFVPNKDSIFTAFNSYNRNHGIITQSALIALKANGMR